MQSPQPRPQQKDVRKFLKAACLGEIDVVTKFLDKYGAMIIERPTTGGATALMYAAHFGHLDTVALLLERGANIDTKSDCGQTALVWASAQGKTDVVALLEKTLHQRAEEKIKNQQLADITKAVKAGLAHDTPLPRPFRPRPPS